MKIVLNLLLAGSAAFLAGSAAYAQEASDWSGPYVGVHAGYTSVKPHYSEPGFPDYNLNPNLDGFAGGALVGYNYQMNGVVLGAEADFGIADSSKGPNLNPSFNDYTSFKTHWNAHARVRAGYPIGKTLVYAAGGLALAHLRVDDTDPGWDSKTATHVGWTIGGGVEHAITDKVTLRIEYLYDDYGSKSHEFTDGSGSYLATWHPKANNVRTALTYKF